MNPEIKKLAESRLQRAQEALKEGVILLERKSLPGAVNRLYYAAFYAARSLLATKELDSSKHSGVIALFHEHFVKTAQFDQEKAKALSRSFEMRQDSDYEDFVQVTHEEVLRIKQEVEKFILECEKRLKGLL